MKQVILTIALMLSLADTAAASLTGLSDGENNVRNTLANRDGLIGFVGFHFKKKPQKGALHKDNDCLQSLCLCHLLPSGGQDDSNHLCLNLHTMLLCMLLLPFGQRHQILARCLIRVALFCWGRSK